MSSIIEALNKIQQELKAPKGQFNGFGKYKYRSCEDILEAVKPFLIQSTITLSDDVVEVGGRVYVKATATFSTCEDRFQVTAFAREALTKKGMDDSQITGTASSYARKYALNGLLSIDDTKDADTNEAHHNMSQQQPAQQQAQAFYSDTAFNKNLQTWIDAITSGAKSVDDIIQMVKTKAPLTAHQITTLKEGAAA
ncbi:MAG: ERF family protein [Ghiorsea sp.]